MKIGVRAHDYGKSVHMSVLREEINPQNAVEDICFMKRMIEQ